MNWFKKSSSANNENPHRQQKHKRVKKTAVNNLSKSQSLPLPSTNDSNLDSKKIVRIASCHNIEIVDPEIFFQDPDHVRNYKEEAVFLKIMSEWEIVENPSTMMDNFFSADFEEEFVNMRTQQQQQHQQLAEVNALTEAAFTQTVLHESCDDNNMKKSSKKNRKRSYNKRSLSELFFADKIEVGLLPPMKSSSPPDTLTTTPPSSNQCSPKLHKKRRCIREDLLQESFMNTPPTCSIGIIKDCAIDRSQLKTEALACSIMGAIGKCPAKDKTPGSSIKDLIQETGDFCHPINSCDHYDIKQFFRLDDNGNILLNMSHIEEIKGFGFASAENKRLYRRYLGEGYSAEEDAFCMRKCCMEILKRMLTLMWNNIKCHPRNKINLCNGGPGDTVRSYTLQLAADQCTTFARNIENFISCTKDSREAAPQVVMRNMRQFMNGMKNYLVKHGEGKFHQEVETARSRLKSDEFLNLDAILETVMHQLVVLPLREHLYGMFVDYYTRSEDIQLLAQNVKYACGRSAADFGIRPTVTPPSATSLQIISNLLLRLQEAELPLEKLELFLCVISTIFDATGCPRGQQLGADDFLPILVYVVAKCGFVGAEIEAEFMWGLLQPTLLNGEPGYYLTALCSAVHVLKSFMASENESGSGSLDWRSSSLPACSSVLRVIIPDECNGSLQTRTLPVRPHTSTREVCRIIAHKARITNPQDYALFKLVDGEETLLNESECPQDIRLAAKGKHCMLAYKRIDAKIAWPTATQPNFN
ncbi:protein sprint isoform X5 [Lucilia cuprina]|uniref:protein sprint isoform X5 n=1 Tax=Lucilia cuprina TaxID=7375 RepID=UPI001F06467A|nr:protein sprint isoform X5 [Lucilia cuprina]